MWIAAGLATMVVALAAAACLVRPGRRIVVRGGWAELHDHVAMLREPRRRIRGLRVDLPGVDSRWLGIMRERRGLRLELAAASATEGAVETAFRAACEAQGITPAAVTRATDRNRFIMALVPAEAAQPGAIIAAIVDATFAPGADPELHVTLLL